MAWCFHLMQNSHILRSKEIWTQIFYITIYIFISHLYFKTFVNISHYITLYIPIISHKNFLFPVECSYEINHAMFNFRMLKTYSVSPKKATYWNQTFVAHVWIGMLGFPNESKNVLSVRAENFYARVEN